MHLNTKFNLFTALYIVYLIVGAVLLVQLNKGDLVIWFNQHPSYTADIFFRIFTEVGDGWFFIVIAVALAFFVNYFYGLLALASYGVSALTTQAFKRLVFAEHHRPSVILDNKLLHKVDGVEWHCCNSFPSGHSTSAFALFLFLSFVTKNRLLQPFFFACALTVTFSRMYLSQHFFEDTYAGSFIGVSTTWLLCWYVQNKTTLADNKSLQSSLRAFVKKS